MKNNAPEVVVVTGASAGVGRAIAQAFGKRGACVGLVARGHAGLEQACKDVEAAGGKAIAIPTDVSDADEVEAAAQKVEDTFGPIDVWVNDAMESVFSPFKEMKPEDFKRVTEVAYLGFVYGTMAALHHMLPRDKGRIIQIGSALAYRSIPLQSAYCGAKHGIMGFTDSIRCELIHDRSNVKITMVQLPAVNTPQFGWVKSNLPDKVDASAEAYSRFSTPDGVLGLGNYAITMGLAAMGEQNRAKQHPWIPLMLAAKVAFDTSQAIRLFVDQKTKQKAFCSWCLLAAGTTIATVPLVIPETYAAIRQLTHHS